MYTSSSTSTSDSSNSPSVSHVANQVPAIVIESSCSALEDNDPCSIGVAIGNEQACDNKLNYFF